MAVTGRLEVITNVKETITADLAPAVQEVLQRYGWDIVSGTGASQADRFWHDTRTLAASGTEDIDLNPGPAGSFGAVLFAKLKAIVVQAAVANTNDVQVTRPAANGVPFMMAAGDGVALSPGDEFHLTKRGSGWTVTGATGDLITITNSAGGTGITYTIILIGTSA